MVDINKVLAERQKTHGDYRDHARITQALKNEIGNDDGNLNDCQKESLDMIVHKIGRILAGNPNTKDHWVDIAGYAQLVANQLDEPAPGEVSG